MSNVQIPNLPAVASLSGDELFEGVQAGSSVKIRLGQIAAFSGSIQSNGQYNFSTRASFVIANTTSPGLGLTDGQVSVAGGYEYRRLAASTAIPDLPGWVPNAVVTPQHFGAVANGVVDDTAAVQAAVTQAFTTGDNLYWPDGTYLTISSISNLHSVNHFGPGVIQRGANAFYVDPRGSQSNTVFIATTGNNASDGLSSSEPRLTFQSAFDAVANYGKPVLDGVWNIVAAAGTYTIASGQQTFSTPSKNRVVIRGPSVGGHPNVPTCIVDGGGNGAAYDHGLASSGPGVSVEFREIKFQNFTEASGNTRIGLVGQNRCDFLTTNVHTFSCSWTGIYATVTDRARIGGGILDANNLGAYGAIIDTTECTLGYLGGVSSNRPIIRNAVSAGIYWSTGSQGHADYCDVEDNGIGFLIAENARCDTVNLNFKRNTVAIRARTGGVWGEGGTANVYNQGTADANGTVFQALAFSGNTTELDDDDSGTYVRVAYDRTTRTASGAASYSFPTIYTLPDYRLQGAGKSMRVHIKGVYTVTASSTVVVNIGGMAVSFTVPAAATSVAFTVDFELMDVAGGYRAIGSLSAGLNTARFATATAGFTVTAASAVNISGNLTGAGDSINIYRTDIYLMG